MEKVKSWLFTNKGSASEIKDIESIEKDQHNQKHISFTQEVVTKSTVTDPKVVEYFKDFPEPYKSKAIARFSSREGFYRWDIIRDLAMKKEFDAGARGIFLEDKREFIKRLQEYEERTKEVTNKTNDIREQSELEKAIRSRIPVHEDETLGLKLYQTVNFSLLGVAVLWAGISLKKRKPTIPTWQCYMTAAGCSYFCAYLQIAALCRLMDWGPFDRSIDNRDALTKTTEEIKQYFSTFAGNIGSGKNEP